VDVRPLADVHAVHDREHALVMLVHALVVTAHPTISPRSAGRTASGKVSDS